jgi:hypothetical protein
MIVSLSSYLYDYDDPITVMILGMTFMMMFSSLLSDDLIKTRYDLDDDITFTILDVILITSL